MEKGQENDMKGAIYVGGHCDIDGDWIANIKCPYCMNAETDSGITSVKQCERCGKKYKVEGDNEK